MKSKSRGRLVLLLVGFLLAILVGWRLPAWVNYYRHSWTDRAVFNMDRRGNLAIKFHGLVVDQDGRPVPGAQINVEVCAFNENWAYEKKPERMKYTHDALTTTAVGRFELDARGNYLKINAVRHPGYRWLYDENLSEEAGDNRFFAFATDGQPRPYQPDPASPAVFVLIKNGTATSSVAPSRGGREQGWASGMTMVNEARWPQIPSVKDVRYVGPPLNVITNSTTSKR